MTAAVQPHPTARTARANFDPSTELPIADLFPSQTGPDAHILAQVALVWPYSSSTGTFALLLADPDIRRRKSKGQVKVVFRNGCAKEVAKTKVGIGDTIKLALVGCEWKETGDVVSTPGKKINWDLEYNTRVLLEVLRSNQEATTVDFTGKETDSSTTHGYLTYLNGKDHEQPVLHGVLHHQSSTIHVPYLTPRKAAGNHPTGTFIDTALEYLAENDGYVLGRGRKRTKFARNSGAWSFVDLEAENQPAEPRKVEVDNADAAQCQSPQAKEVALAPGPAALDREDQIEHQILAEVSKEVVQPTSTVQVTEEDIVDVSSPVSPTEFIPPPIVTQPLVMGPPQTPRRASPPRQPAIDNTDDSNTSDGSEAATTPRLLPIPSPGLPLVSPLVHRSGVEIGYFPPFDMSISHLDAAAIPGAEIIDLADRPSPLSDGSPVVIVGASTSEAAANGFEAGDIAHGDTVLVSHESEVALEDQESTKKTAYEAPQWLSSLESSIDRELLLSQDQSASHSVSQHASQAFEVEDDDLYGAPVEAPKANHSVATSPSVERPKSPLDVLEQFLQIPPTTALGFSLPLESDGEHNRPNTPLEQDAPEGMSMDTPQERVEVSANSKRSHSTYPEPQSPFRQNQQHQASPVNSTRPPSSQASRPQSLDGHMDERERFREYIDHLAQFSANSESSKQLVPDSESSHDNFRSETHLKTDVSVTTTKVDEAAHVDSSGHVTEVVKQATDQSLEQKKPTKNHNILLLLQQKRRSRLCLRYPNISTHTSLMHSYQLRSSPNCTVRQLSLKRQNPSRS
ncbi:hypothetical protein CLAIMM_12927 [Cladophialophora immunda]|nr:hypothetical protein CLAIMM_12927 [Cladophialophora immunda]